MASSAQAISAKANGSADHPFIKALPSSQNASSKGTAGIAFRPVNVSNEKFNNQLRTLLFQSQTEERVHTCDDMELNEKSNPRRINQRLLADRVLQVEKATLHNSTTHREGRSGTQQKSAFVTATATGSRFYNSKPFTTMGVPSASQASATRGAVGMIPQDTSSLPGANSPSISTVNRSNLIKNANQEPSQVDDASAPDDVTMIQDESH